MSVQKYTCKRAKLNVKRSIFFFFFFNINEIRNTYKVNERKIFFLQQIIFYCRYIRVRINTKKKLQNNYECRYEHLTTTVCVSAQNPINFID